jgi:hypothetical protein
MKSNHITLELFLKHPPNTDCTTYKTNEHVPIHNTLQQTTMAIDDLHGGSAHHTEWSMDTATDHNIELSIGAKLVLVALVFVFILLSTITFSKLIRLEKQEMQQQKDR